MIEFESFSHMISWWCMIFLSTYDLSAQVCGYQSSFHVAIEKSVRISRVIRSLKKDVLNKRKLNSLTFWEMQNFSFQRSEHLPFRLCQGNSLHSKKRAPCQKRRDKEVFKMRRSARLSARKSLIPNESEEVSLEKIKRTPAKKNPSKKKAEQTPSKKSGRRKKEENTNDVVLKEIKESQTVEIEDSEDGNANNLEGNLNEEAGVEFDFARMNQFEEKTVKEKAETDSEIDLAVASKQSTEINKSPVKGKDNEIVHSEAEADGADKDELNEGVCVITHKMSPVFPKKNFRKDIRRGPSFEVLSKEIFTDVDTENSEEEVKLSRKNNGVIVLSDSSEVYEYPVASARVKEFMDDRSENKNAKEINSNQLEEIFKTTEVEATMKHVDNVSRSKESLETETTSKNRKGLQTKRNLKKLRLNKSGISLMEGKAQSNNLLKLTCDAFKNLPFKITKDDLENEETAKVKDKESKEEDIHKLDMILLSINEKKEQLKKKKTFKLSSKLNPGIDTKDLYFQLKKDKTEPVRANISKDEDRNNKKTLKKSEIGPDFEKQEKSQARETATQKAKRKQKEREETAGPGWYNLPKTEMTEEIKRDMQLIKMRHLLDPKRFYKKGFKKPPKYFQIGTVVAGAADFYSSRIPKKSRKRTMVDELLSDAEFRRRNKRKFLEIQEKKQSGGKRHYKAMKNKRKKTWERT